jgi:hypothetical protein
MGGNISLEVYYSMEKYEKKGRKKMMGYGGVSLSRS